jgi:hypothetical protein
MGSRSRRCSNRTALEATGCESIASSNAPPASAWVTPQRSTSSPRRTGRSRKSHATWRRLSQLLRRRSETSGARSLRWRGGNGSDGSTRPGTQTRASAASRSASRRWKAGSDGPAVSTLPPAPTPTSRGTAGFSGFPEVPPSVVVTQARPESTPRRPPAGADPDHLSLLVVLHAEAVIDRRRLRHV